MSKSIPLHGPDESHDHSCSCCSLLCTSEELMDPCPLRAASLGQISRSVQESPLQNGKPLSFDFAVKTAQDWLRQSKFPLVSGPIVDVESARAAIRLASRFDAAIDVSASTSLFDTIEVLQVDGMVSTSFAEVAQHSDCLLVVGDDSLLERYPQLPQQIASRGSHSKSRRLVLLGKWSDEASQRFSMSQIQVLRFESNLNRLPLGMAELDRFAVENETLLGDSKNVVVLWANDCLSSVSALDLWLQSWNRWAKNPPPHQRRSILPLTSLQGTFAQVCTWTTGFPGRVRFRNGDPLYDADRYHAPILLQDRCVDLLVWVHSSSRREGVFHPVPNRTILISPFPPNAEQSGDWIWFPTAVPGIDYRSIFFRADQAVCLAIGPIRSNEVDAASVEKKVSDILGSLIA